MADKVIVSREKLVAVADAVREKTGGTESLTLDEMPGTIVGIETGGGDLSGLVGGTITEFNDSSLTSIRPYAFYGCQELVSVDLPSLLSVTARVFYDCSKLKSLHLPSVESIGEWAFYSCNLLASINLPELVEISSRAFQECWVLEDVNVPKLKTIGTSALSFTPKLQRLDLPSCTSIGASAFHKDFSLTTVILRSGNVCTLSATNVFQECYHYHGTKNATYNPNGLKDGYIYVPAALVDEYKAATNWSTFADQIRAIEDYPEITGG